jgi:hypothetical protein
MKKKKHTYQISMFLLSLQFFTSCVTYKDFSITHKMAKPIDFMDPPVKQAFELDKVYRIQLDDTRLIDLRVVEIREDRLMGVQKNNNIKKGTELQGLLEIPFQKIVHVEEKRIDALGTLGLAAVIYVVVALIAWGLWLE